MDVFKTLCDGAYRQIYDVNIDETTYMKKICANVTVLYQLSKKIAIVSPRDFVIINYMHQVSEI